MHFKCHWSTNFFFCVTSHFRKKSLIEGGVTLPHANSVNIANRKVSVCRYTHCIYTIKNISIVIDIWEEGNYAVVEERASEKCLHNNDLKPPLSQNLLHFIDIIRWNSVRNLATLVNDLTHSLFLSGEEHTLAVGPEPTQNEQLDIFSRHWFLWAVH